MADEAAAVRLRAFVGRSFWPEDEALWFDIRKVLESLGSLGFVFEDAERAQLRPVSEKVRQGIERTDLFVGILTRRLPIASTSLFARLRPLKQTAQWTTSEWVVQESGYALGRGKSVILLIEQGVVYPTADLDADTEWLRFDRSHLGECRLRLIQMINQLIAKTLPVVEVPALSGAPKAEEAATEEQRALTEPSLGLVDVMDLLEKQEFVRADAAFEALLQPQPSEKHELLRYWYLEYKYFNGHTESLDEIKDVVRREPGNLRARRVLASCYRRFDAPSEAARILLEGRELVSVTDRPGLLRTAAEDLATDEARSNALIAELLSTFSAGDDQRLTYIALADIAERRAAPDLESAALERALEINPADLTLRFRLAYLYGKVGNHKLAVYHYQIHTKQQGGGMASNNLAVAFGDLQLPAKQVTALEAASDEIPLARANLSHLFVTAGFLRRARELAETIGSEDSVARDRAAGALRRSRDIESKEDEAERRLLDEAKTERDFRAAYAIAFGDASELPIRGVYGTPWGNLPLEQAGDQITGEAEFQETVPLAWGGLAAALRGVTPGSSEHYTRSRRVRLAGRRVGRAATFRVETTTTTDLLPQFAPKTSVVDGLLIIEAAALRLLEKGDDGVKVYSISRGA